MVANWWKFNFCAHLMSFIFRFWKTFNFHLHKHLIFHLIFTELSRPAAPARWARAQFQQVKPSLYWAILLRRSTHGQHWLIGWSVVRITPLCRWPGGMWGTCPRRGNVRWVANKDAGWISITNLFEFSNFHRTLNFRTYSVMKYRRSENCCINFLGKSRKNLVKI